MIAHPNRRSVKKTATHPQTHDHDHDYGALLTSVGISFDAIASTGTKLFLTDAEGLNELYLDSLPSERQTHNCHSCRRFIEMYGSLVAIGDDGELFPVMWNPGNVPEFYRAAFAAIADKVKRARVVSVFLTKQKVWGTPTTGNWSHMAVVPPPSLVYREGALTDSQAMAASKENFRTVATALAELKAPMLDEALRLLRADSLARSEKFIGSAAWLRKLHDRPKGRRGENVLWRAIASAPEGYCHPKASVIGPLLEDIASGMSFEDIKKRFDAKMHPLAYQRPQAAPTAGNIKAAEALVQKMGIAPSLERRFARLDDLQQMVWAPKVPKVASAAGGVFGHLKPKDAWNDIVPLSLPSMTMTWDKFSRAVLPNAERIELMVPGRGRFLALTTAVNADAPPILKWDREEERNPVAWYVYPGGSVAAQWGLVGRQWAKVTAVVPLPTLWSSKPSVFLGEGVVLTLEGAVDTNSTSGNALFPECMKDDLHAVRATIEAYSRSAQLSGREDASACGYDVRKDAADCDLRVFDGSGWVAYHIDRWD